MTMMTLYVLCVAAGGILMGTSIFFGGDHDGDADADVDAHADVDLHVDGDAHADFDHDVGHADGAAGHHGGGFEMSVLPFGSLRFWTFLIESFGLTGALLSCAGIPSGATLGISLFAGTVMGWAAFAFFRWLAREEVSGATALEDFKNSEGRVLVRIPVGGQGKIALEQASGRVEMLARTLDATEIPIGAQVLVVGIADGVAEVTTLAPAAPTATEQARRPAAARQTEKNL